MRTQRALATAACVWDGRLRAVAEARSEYFEVEPYPLPSYFCVEHLEELKIFQCILAAVAQRLRASFSDEEVLDV
ncbi:hypothetical protein EVAR_37031_1 [Eumeta japonica]|uniref:Uncharacterized protein n=1 Tax=Eumeta variegata TaxID=151549 RepID=A0A4C1WF19_EUMVA|nr:hypothetical protein EVAR_37031_1 [Eumeta japonica]